VSETWLARTRTSPARVSAAERPSRDVTVDAYVATYLSRRPTLSPKTAESYASGHALQISPTLGRVRLGKVAADTISVGGPICCAACPRAAGD